MSTQPNDGGQAFPCYRDMASSLMSGRADRVPVRGMSLRDYFAAHALQGMLARGMSKTVRERADAAYMHADAMLRAREARDAT